jgi:hypothetical protein
VGKAYKNDYTSLMSASEDKPYPTAVPLIAWTLAGLLGLFIILGSLGLFDGGNVSNKECFNYEKANGDWANSCDQ